MSAHPHLLYPDLFLYEAHIQIRLYRWGELVAVYAADAITPEQLETGVLCRACDHAPCSMVNAETLRHYHAVAETYRGTVLVRYHRSELQFEASLT